MAIKPLEIEIAFEKKHFQAFLVPKFSWQKVGQEKSRSIGHMWCRTLVFIYQKIMDPIKPVYSMSKKTSRTNNSQAQDCCSLCSPTTTSERFFCQEKNVDKIKPVYSLPKKNAKQSSQSKDSCFLCFPSTTGEVDTSAVCQKPWETNRRL